MTTTASSLAIVPTAPTAAARRTYADTPAEEWWSWNGIDVHLDRLAVPESPIKVIVLHGAERTGA